MKEFDEIDELYGNAFADFEVTPPAELKSAIDEKVFSSKKRSDFLYFGLNGILLILFITINLFFGYEVTPTVSAKNQIESPEISNSENSFLSNSGKKKEIKKETDLFISENNQIANEVNTTEKKSTNLIAEKAPKTLSGNKKLNSSVQPRKELETGIEKHEKLDSNKGLDNSGLLTKQDKNLIKDNLATEIEAQSNDKKEPELTAEISANDSLLADQPEKNELPLNLVKVKPSPFLQFYGGLNYGFSNLKNDDPNLQVKALQPAYEMGIEYNYSLNDKLSLTSGLGLVAYHEKYSKLESIPDSIFSGNFTEIIYFDTVTQQNDTIYVALYNSYLNESWKDQVISVSSFVIPLYARWTVNREDKYEFAISGGLRFSYNRSRVIEGEELGYYSTISNFSVSAMVRPEFVYRIKKIGIGAYVSYSRDLIQVINFENNKRNRQMIGLGLLLRYNF